MKWFKNSFLLANLLLLFVWSSKDATLFSETVSSVSTTVQTVDSIKVVGTNQSIGHYQFQSIVKESSTLLFSFFHTTFEEIKTFVPSKFTIFLSRQDHNRCEKVSSLLFPYHFFW